MPEKAPLRWPEFSCWKKFTSGSWPLKHIKLHHPERLQVPHQKNPTNGSAPRHFEPTQRGESNAKNESVEELDAFPSHEQVEYIADSESQPPQPPLPQTEIYPGAGTPLCDCIGEPWERNTPGCLEPNLQYNPNYPLATCEEYKCIHCGIKWKGIKTYYDNVLKVKKHHSMFPMVQKRQRSPEARG